MTKQCDQIHIIGSYKFGHTKKCQLKGVVAAEAVPVHFLKILQHSLSMCNYDLYDLRLWLICMLGQRTLTVGGSITVWLVSSLTRLELTSEGNIILFVFSEAV